jgi:hypothetical protein
MYQQKGQGLELQKAVARNMHDADTDYTGTAWHKYLKDIGLYNELYGEISHQFITIGLPNDYPLDNIKKYIAKPHAWLSGATLAVERFRKNGEHLHIHILTDKPHNKTKAIRDLSRKFKVAPNYIDVRRSNSQADYNNRRNYIRGDKQDTAKLECVEKDIQWRKDNDFENYYLL